MFGILRPCRNRLGEELRAVWTAHLCGMCLALRDEHGQLARLITNYDAVVVSALVEAQTGTDGRRREAGPCALRGLRRASVATAGGAELAAAVSLLLVSAKITDHVADGDLDGALRVRAARTVARRLATAGRAGATGVALDAVALLDAVADQAAAELGPASLLEVTAATEAATALAFAHTAVVAGRAENVETLREVGRLFGRLAHLLDAVEDLHDDARAGRWNPIVALGLTPAEVRAVCDDARLGIRLALRDTSFVDDRLVHLLLVHETATAVRRSFTASGQPPLTPPLPPNQQPPGPVPPGWQQPPPGWGASPTGWGPPPPTTRRPGPWAGCLGWLVVCGTCQVCCAGEYTDPCSGEQRSGDCRGENACDCCSGCCDVGDCCGGCCDCVDCCDCSC